MNTLENPEKANHAIALAEQQQEAEYQAIKLQIRSSLEALAPTEHSIPNVSFIDSEIGSLEKTIKGLKGFISFLSKLNPMEYLRWMKEAFSNYIASAKVLDTASSDEASTELSSASYEETLSVRPKSSSQIKKKKKKLLTLS